jgi:hypothetical protein
MNRILTVLGTCLLLVGTGHAQAECNSLLRKSFDHTQIVAHDDGTVVDLGTGLMWQRCALGFQWQSGTCTRNTAAAAELTWEDALIAAAANKTFAGHRDWRLPNKNELGSLVERACFSPAIDENLFPNTEAKGYWTNSPNNFNEFSAWAVNFTDGDHMSTSRTNPLAARLVRPLQ